MLPAALGIPWPCVHAFLAIATHPKICRPPTPSQRLRQVEIWMESPSLRLWGELTGHRDELRDVLSAGKIVGGAAHDARIMAICREHGLRTANPGRGEFRPYRLELKAGDQIRAFTITRDRGKEEAIGADTPVAAALASWIQVRPARRKCQVKHARAQVTEQLLAQGGVAGVAMPWQEILEALDANL